MLVGIAGWIVGQVLRLIGGNAVQKAVEVFNQASNNGVQLARISADERIAEGANLADLNKAKLQFPWFWVLISLFVVPLALWWIAVIADSIFLFPFDVADLPTPEMRSWAGDMIRWLFYVGTGTGALKVLSK